MLKTLVKIRLASLWQSMFGRMTRQGTSMSGTKKILMGLLALYVVGAIGFSVGMMFYAMARAVASFNMEWLYWTGSSLMAFMLCFVGSIFVTHQQIFSAKDNELLLSMPVRPRTILTSRLISLFALNLIYSAVIMLPAALSYFIATSSISVSQIIAVILSMIMLPLLSMSIACVFSYLLAQLTARLRYKNLIIIAFSALFFVFYMYAAFNLSQYMGKLIANGAEIGAAIQKAFPPMYAFGMAASGHGISGFIQLSLWCVIPFAVMFFVLSRSFISLITAKKGEVKSQYKEQKMHLSGAFSAMLAKEFRRIFGTPIYMINSALGSIFILIIGGAVLLKGEGFLASMTAQFMATGATVDISLLVVPILCAGLAFCGIMVCTSCVSLSLEGSSVWLLKSLPLSEQTILGAKIAANVILGVVPLIFTFFCSIYVFEMSAVQMAVLLLLPISVQVFGAVFGMTINLCMPRFDWISEASVVKQSGSSLVTIFGLMAIIFAPTIAYIAWLAPIMSFEVFGLISTAVFAIASLLLYIYTMKLGKKVLQRI